MYIVIREEVAANLKFLEKLNKICSDDFRFHKDYTTLKERIKKDIDYYKWKLSKKRVKEWCETNKQELAYFMTKEEFDNWRELEDVIQNHNIELLKLEQKQKDIIAQIETKKTEVRDVALEALYNNQYLFNDDDPILKNFRDFNNIEDVVLEDFTDKIPFQSI